MAEPGESRSRLRRVLHRWSFHQIVMVFKLYASVFQPRYQLTTWKVAWKRRFAIRGVPPLSAVRRPPPFPPAQNLHLRLTNHLIIHGGLLVQLQVGRRSACWLSSEYLESGVWVSHEAGGADSFRREGPLLPLGASLDILITFESHCCLSALSHQARLRACWRLPSCGGLLYWLLLSCCICRQDQVLRRFYTTGTLKVDHRLIAVLFVTR